MGVELTLIPSERRLALAGGNSGGIPLWERVTPLGQPTGELVHCHLVVPANMKEEPLPRGPGHLPAPIPTNEYARN